MPILVAEFVQLKLDVIVNFGGIAGVAIKNAHRGSFCFDGLRT